MLGRRRVLARSLHSPGYRGSERPPGYDPADMSAETSDERRERAEACYAQELTRSGLQDQVDVDALCARNRELATELRSVHADWLRVKSVWRTLGRGLPVGERLRDRYGSWVDPAIALEPEPGQGSGTLRSVIGRLGLKLPRQSRYEVLEEVARGGMGAVLKVWDPDLRRTLAMKVALSPTAPDGGDAPDSSAELPLARFLEEAQVTGQLDHPGVVPVHELGIDDEGRVFFTMRLVRGESLEAIIARVHGSDPDWTLARAVRVLLKICETMAYAHDKGVIHRDLKPANVMVGRFGEMYVMDWGLARVMGRADKKDLRIKRRDSTSLHLIRTDRGDVRATGGGSVLETMDGDVVGTPAYMSPQQALGEVEGLDQRTDVYALGAILYHLLSGHMPYVPPGRKMSPHAVWSLVMDGKPHPIEERAPNAPPELIAICNKAMERAPGDRYQTAQALSEDLASFLDGRVVRAYERGAWAELRKWVGRNKGLAAASAAALVIALGGLGAVSWVQARANRELGDKNVALAQANAAERQASEEARAAKTVAEQTAVEVTRQRDGADRVIEFLVSLFESPDPARTRGAPVSAKDLLDRGARTIASELEQDPLVRARLMETMGRAYHELGLFDDAEPLLGEALTEREARLGADHPETLAAQNAVARLRGAKGEWQRAQTLFEQALERERVVLGDEHRATLDTRNELGKLYRNQARFAEACAALEAVLADRRRVLGDSDPDTLETYLDLARARRDRNELEAAAQLLAHALPSYRASLGDDHPATLRALNELAVIEQQSGRWDDAQAHLLESWEGRQRVLGPDHPETLWSLADRAFLALRLGRYAEAEELYADALERHRRVLGESHPDSLALLVGLGGLYQLEGRLPEAEELLTEAADRALAALGPDDPRTLGCQFGLAAVFFKQGRHDEAEPIYRQALDGYRQVMGPSHPQTLTIQEDLVLLLTERGALDEALSLARDLLERTAPEDDARPARAELLSSLDGRR